MSVGAGSGGGSCAGAGGGSTGAGTCSGGSSGADTPYRQKYKRAWELDIELRDWIQPCQTDAHAAWCKYCRSKLHAHKKGLLAHSRSAKHKKHVLNPATDDQMDTTSDHGLGLNDSFGTPKVISISGDGFANATGAAGSSTPNNNTADDAMSADGKIRQSARRSGLHQFNDQWLSDPLFNVWVRKIPSNATKALCIACRCVITAGRSELLKHSQSAKHKKAVLMGPFEELNDVDLEWLDQTYNDTGSGGSMAATVLNIPSVASYQQHNHQGYTHYVTPNTRGVFETRGMPLEQVIAHLKEHVPLEYAESWDNVGVMVKPTQETKVHNVLITIDLNESIVEEAIKKRAQFIISYHPPIFQALKKMVPENWKEKALLMCIENRIAVYSPHTALDAVRNGINDWLLSAFSPNSLSKSTDPIVMSGRSRQNTNQDVIVEQHNGVHEAATDSCDKGNSEQSTQEAGADQRAPEQPDNAAATEADAIMQEDCPDRSRPITYSHDKTFSASIELMLTDQHDSITQALQGIDNVMMTVRHNTDFGGTDVRLSCAETTLPEVLNVLHKHPYAQMCSRVTRLVPTPIPGVGMGRLLTLKSPLPLYEVVHRTKQHLDQTNVRLGLSPRHTRDTKVTRIAVCAGSGATVLKECAGQADIWITGEMSHHEVLDATRHGATVILCEHSNTERGYLRHWANMLKGQVLGDAVNVLVSDQDRDPLRVV